jgi:hypothetical protein
MFDKALTFGGWPGLLLLLLGNVAGVSIWSICVLTRRYREAFYVSIMAFPFTFYAARAAGIRVYDAPDFDQRIGLSTLLILSLFLILLVTGRIRRPKDRLSRSIESLLWLFAISLTASQFASHEPFAAVMLSIGAAWQFVVLFYLLFSLIRRERDLFALLNSLFVFSLLNIVVRVVAKGERLIVPLSLQTAGDAAAFGAEAGRVGSGALGPGPQYAAYLAIFISLALGVYFATRKSIYLGYVALMFVELLNTFTRGGLFVLTLLLLLFWFKRTRSKAAAVGLLAVAVLIIAWPIVYKYAVFRGFSINVVGVGSFSLRMDLIKMFVSEYHFSWWGHGILKPTLFELAPWLIVPIHNTYLEVLDTCGPLTLLFFVALSIYMVLAAIRGCRLRMPRPGNEPLSTRLAPFVLIALLQWIVYANTTSTSILAYFPYEGMSVFWIVGFLPSLCFSMQRRAGAMVADRRRRMAVGRRSATLNLHPVANRRRRLVSDGTGPSETID